MLDFSVTFIITIINITILFFILKSVLFKPVTKIMEDRAKRVQDTIEQAQKDKDEAMSLLDKYQNKLKNAEAEAREILKTASENAARQAQLIISEGRQEAQDTVNSALKQIEMERQAALAKFKLEAATLVIAVSAKLASKDFSGEDSRRYANMLMDELSAQKGSD